MQPDHHSTHTFTFKILLGMLAGMVAGLLIKWLPLPGGLQAFLVTDILKLGGKIFLNLIRMMVVPIVLVSIICGVGALGDLHKLGRVGLKTLLLYIFTTAIAIALALGVASLFHIGDGMSLQATSADFAGKVPPVRELISEMFPSNPINAMAEGNMLQLIVFAILFGMAMSLCGDAGKRLGSTLKDAESILMRLIMMIMQTAPYGVFCLLAALFADQGFDVIFYLISYFGVVLLVLTLQLLGTYALMLRFLGKLSPWHFYYKMRDAMLFAFGVSSSNASIPVVLKTVEEKLGVDNSVASFVIPLGATINMDGTAIMQGVATVLIANAYNIPIGMSGYLTVIGMSTLASIATAGVPGIGLITLAMVLEQVGLPVKGIMLIIGVDRLLDMARTVVNISCDSMVACLVGKSEACLNEDIFKDNNGSQSTDREAL